MARPASDEVLRFLAKVEHVASGCHEWRSTVKRDGYGAFYFRGRSGFPAHRVSYILFNGSIPEGKCVMHKCDNKICVNPEHLMIGTAQDNIKDMDLKGRRGTKSKITYAESDEIRRMLEDRYTQEFIAKKYGIDQTTVSRIKLGKTNLFKERN
jgi:hypothetical protein